jgi:hypothetical protein
MNKELRKQILTAYDLHDDPDISIEMLLELVANACQCDQSDVVEALQESARS